jgi:hypothetical protein
MTHQLCSVPKLRNMSGGRKTTNLHSRYTLDTILSYLFPAPVTYDGYIVLLELGTWNFVGVDQSGTDLFLL